MVTTNRYDASRWKYLSKRDAPVERKSTALSRSKFVGDEKAVQDKPLTFYFATDGFRAKADVRHFLSLSLHHFPH